MRQNFKPQPSPSGRGWTAAGVFTSRSGPGEGPLGPASGVQEPTVRNSLTVQPTVRKMLTVATTL
jgi:hypothetical protein